MQQTPIKYGIIAGTATVLYLLAFYLTGPANLLNPLVYWSSLLIPMVAMVLATRQVREGQGGRISKKEAIKTSFIVWIISMVLFHVFMYVVFNLDDNELIDLQKARIEEATGTVIKREDLTMSVGQVFFRAAFMLLPGFLLSWMVASFLKK